MKAIILAAGRGRRLKSLTARLPKCLLRINGKPMLYYQIEALRRHKIRTIVMVLGYKHEKIIEYCLKHFRDCMFTFIVNPFYETTNSLVSMWFARGHLDSEFIYMHSDILFDPAILAKIKQDNRKAVIAIEQKRCDREDLKVKLKDGCLAAINKRMTIWEADGEFIGIAKFKKETALILPRLLDHFVFNKKFMFWFELSWETLIKHIRIHALNVNGKKWIEIDTLSDFRKANELFSDKE
ncbi:MAG: phosphocholine cytidylyltransferase family protein [Candidatus Omnitrophica bacterium]|nr:phosphocholine cytidylyltransferase family protein [Candidatus Omnitrophota bacterium]